MTQQELDAYLDSDHVQYAIKSIIGDGVRAALKVRSEVWFSGISDERVVELAIQHARLAFAYAVLGPLAEKELAANESKISVLDCLRDD